MKPKLIIFDFWGTLAYFPMTDIKEFYSSFKNFGIELKTDQDIKKLSRLFGQSMCFSESWEEFSQRLLEGFVLKPNQKQIKGLVNFVKNKFSFKLYDDVKEILKLPFPKAVLTNSSKLIVKRTNLRGFKKIFTPKETKCLKPNPQAFLTVLKEFDLKPKDAVMIGDEVKRDLLPAQNLGIRTVLIDRENQKDYPGIKINSFQNLSQTVKGL